MAERLRKTNVLVVEDEALLAEEIADRLRRAGYEVVAVVDSGADALAAAERFRLDLVLMDIQLKGAMDGLETGERIHDSFQVPIVFVTAHSDPATLSRSQIAAKFGYVVKPFRERDLLAALDVALNRHKVETALRVRQADTEALFRTAFERASVGVSLVDADGCFLRVNQALCDIVGYSKAELEGRSFNDLTHPEDRSEGTDVVAQAVGGGPSTRSLEKRYVHKDGHVVWVHIAIAFVPRPGDARDLFISYTNDITERKVAEAERAHLVERLRERVEALTLLEGTTRRLNRLLALLGEINKVIIRETPEAIPGEVCRVAVERAGFRLAWIGLVDEAGRRLSPVASAGHDEGYVEHVAIDLSDETRARGPSGRALAEGTPIICEDTATSEAFVPWREAAMSRGLRSSVALPLRVLGKAIGVLNLYAAEPSAFTSEHLPLLEELADNVAFALEMSRRGARQVLVEQDLFTSERRFSTAFENAPIGMALLAPDGRCLLVNRALAAITGCDARTLLARNLRDLVRPEDLGALEELVARALSQEAATSPTDLRFSRGGEHVWVAVGLSVARDRDGRAMHVVAQLQDVTDRRRIEEELRQAQKLEALGRLAGGIAHDFNNLLTVIMTSLELAREAGGERELVAQELEAAEGAARRAGQLTRQLLGFGRRQPLERRVVDIRRFLADMQTLLRPLLRDDIVLHVADVDAGTTFTDPGRLTQVVMNLAVNARDAMPNGGQLTLDARTVWLDEARKAGGIDLPRGSYVVLEIADTGTGMDETTRQRIFEPFFTTKEPGKGTGLGLSTVFGIVRQSGGSVSVESTPGRGTTFRVYLPSAPAEVAHSEPVAATLSLAGDETVLLVDDDASVRRVTLKILQRHGYHVLVAASPGDALLLAEQHEGRIDLVLSDVLMPHMRGPELVERLRRIRPGIAVLLVSGYTDEKADDGAPPAVVHALLAKPYAPNELVKRVREILDARAR